MSLPLFFVDDATAMDAVARAFSGSAPTVELRFSRDEMKHLRALRIRAGERFMVSDGKGRAYEVELAEALDKSSDSCAVRPVSAAETPFRPNLTLVQGVSKGERMDLLIRQAVEIGVARIIPAMTARCIVSLDAGKRAARGERWRQVARAAAKQSGQPVLPDIGDPVDFDQAVSKAAEEADIVVVPWEESTSGSMAQVLRAAGDDAHVFLFIGPEGGFEKAEVEALEAIGARVVTLGETILRTETAGVIASALAIYELGGLGNAR